MLLAAVVADRLAPSRGEPALALHQRQPPAIVGPLQLDAGAAEPGRQVGQQRLARGLGLGLDVVDPVADVTSVRPIR
jgi:hypothetical protein